MEIRRRSLLAGIAGLSAGAALAPAATFAASEKRVYYYASQLLGHPYLIDMHLGMSYAAKSFGVEIKTVGPQGWDPVAHAEAVEQSIAKRPAGIVTSLWEPGALPAIKRAREQGIPVVVVEATVPDHGALTFIGLDNYQAGVDTARELIRVGGTKGRYAVTGNWGASNTDAKAKGLTDYLSAHSEWELLGRVDDKANTQDAIDAAKSMFNTYPNLTGVVGLDSSSGSGIGLAAEELDIDLSGLAVVVNDREAPVLELIESGAIDSTIINKTALQAFMAIDVLEAYNTPGSGFAGVPISADNAKAGVVPFPQNIYMGTAVINRENVALFKAENLPQKT